MTKIPRCPLTAMILFVSIVLSQITLAQTLEEEEWEVLNLFFKPDELVVSSTHYPKPVAQVAENISIITCEDIEAMNAHSVAEVLNRVTGVFLGGYDRNFGSTASLLIQGSSGYHTLVLLDNIPWNFLVEGNAETLNIPVGIIERIEIIKGPASSSWGSSLGGVVNIITKTFSRKKVAFNHLQASYGENQTSDIRADFNHTFGNAEVFAFAGRMDSDGLLDQKRFENNSAYSKIRLSMTERLTFGLTAGYSEPDMFYGNLQDYDYSSSADIQTGYGTITLDGALTDEIYLELAAYSMQNRYAQKDTTITGDYWGLAPGAVIQSFTLKDIKWGAKGKLVWECGQHTALLGGDLAYGTLKDNTRFAPEFGDGYSLKNHVDTRAVYLNDTLVLNQWAITPGIRYDSNSTSKHFVSPSLGVTFQPLHEVIFRAMASRGFAAPPLVYLSSYVIDLLPNPDLKPEAINSYQVGMEAGLSRRARFKLSLFHHDVENMFFEEYVDSEEKYRYVNAESATRQGFECELQASLFSHLMAEFGGTLVHKTTEAEEDKTLSSINFAIAYQNPDIINTRLMGHYMWWDQDHSNGIDTGSYDDVIFDMVISKAIPMPAFSKAEFFITGHNLFNGSLYDDAFYKNPDRWFECGMNLTF